MPATEPPSLQVLAKYPRMTGWFNPALLVRLLWRVILSELFGEYADRRLIVAALDSATPEEFMNRARFFMPGQPNEHVWTFTPDAEGVVWVDYVADLGDGFDATFAIASLLSQESLTLQGMRLPRGQLLLMGGDEVYPRADRETYQQRLRDPYDWAFPDPNTRLLKGPPVFAIPGNHDWYDGLVIFLAVFCRKTHVHLGGWRTHQRRSYFALQLTERWWVWALDAQLASDIDQPQADYFRAVAERMPLNAKVILCAPEPGWLYTRKQGNRALSVIGYIAWVAKRRGLSIPLVLSGDTHHYSRYEGDDGETQFITSGGGGAFLHSTHELEEEVDLDREKEGFSWLGGKVKKLTLGESGGAKAVYPSQAESLAMLKGNFAFVVYNPAFAILMGGIYWLLALVAALFPSDILWIAPAALITGFWAYTRNQEGGGWKVFTVSAVNGILHALAMPLVVRMVQWLNALYLDDALAFISRLVQWLAPTEPGWSSWPRTTFIVSGLETVLIGGVIAGTLFGAYLYVTSRWFNMNHNDAFSSMRRDSHRNFLRLRIIGDEVTVFPIGLTRVPRRKEWLVNTQRQGSPAPAYVPEPALSPHLIEAGVTVRPKQHKQKLPALDG